MQRLVELYVLTSKYLDKTLEITRELICNRPCWDSYYYLGLVYYKKGDNVMAVRAFEKAVALNPNSTEIWYYLGLARKGLNQMKAARYAWEQGLKINPNHRFIKEELEKSK